MTPQWFCGEVYAGHSPDAVLVPFDPSRVWPRFASKTIAWSCEPVVQHLRT